MGRRVEKERGGRKGEGKEMITINHTAREDSTTVISTMHSPEFHLRRNRLTTNNRCHIGEGVTSSHSKTKGIWSTSLINYVPSKVVHLPKAG